MSHRPVQLGSIALVVMLALAAASDDAVEFSDGELRKIYQHSPLGPLPADTSAFADDPAAARLGQFLFFDKGMSANGEVACATCHVPGQAFADGKTLSEGMGTGTRNSPALWNVAYNRWYFWDGRTDSLWSQALQPIEAPAEMGSSRLYAAHAVYGDTELRRAYEAIFGAMPDLDDTTRFPAEGRPVPDEPKHPHHVAWTSMTPDDQAAINRVYVNIGKAIAAYERKLISSRSPFDVFVEGLRTGDAGKQTAIGPDAKRGLKIFIGTGECRLCHSGPNFTDGEFHNIRVPPGDGGPPRDAGRYEGLRQLLASPFNAAGEFSDDRDGLDAKMLQFVTENPQTWGAFKPPTLRNVILTAPYMHRGQFAAIEDVLHYYSTLEGAISIDHHDEIVLQPRNFTVRQMQDLIAFLESLTDTAIDPSLLEPPATPLPE